MAMQPCKLSGHVFSAYLACPQRAWLDLHGDKKRRLFSPVFLRGMQRAGLRHERDVEERFFPGAMRFDDRLSIEERLKQTEKLLRQGTAVVLQGAVCGTDGVGIVDVLELVGPNNQSRFGYCYRVGEIKHAAALQTGHIFQALWYRDLLLEWGGSAAPDGFFIAGDLVRKDIPAYVYEDAYRRVLRDLRNLQHTAAPREHLCEQCPTCAWRGVCLPELVRLRDLSLLPRLGRVQCQRLRAEGFASCDHVAREVHQMGAVLGLDVYDCECIAVAASRLQGSGAITRELLDWCWIAALEPVAVDIELDADGMPGSGVIPSNLWTEAAGCVDMTTADESCLTSLMSREKLVVYGEADLAGLRNLAAKHKISLKRDPVVLSRLVQAYVHEPMLGYELSCVAAHAVGQPDPEERLMSPCDRLHALRRVCDWIAGRA